MKRSGLSDCESEDEEEASLRSPSRSASEMDECVNEHSDTESDQHSNHDSRKSKSSRPNSRPMGIIDAHEEDTKAHWTACDASDPLIRQRSSSSLSYSSKSILRRRINSASKSTCSSIRPQSVKHPEPEKRSNVASFSRSLRLLGLQPEDFGIKKTESAVKTPRQVRAPAPTLHTRVLERSVSLDALRSALQESLASQNCVSTEQLERETIAKAVYEEWYFKKLDEARKKREAQLTEERNAKERLERIRSERLKKSEDNFAKWKQAKIKEREHVEKKLPTRLRPEAPMVVSKEKADEAFQMWKKEKEKLNELAMKSKQLEIQKKSDKEKARQEKKRDAITTFNAWKKQADEKLRKQHLTREMKKKAEEDKKERENQERVENSKTSFFHWKAMKDELLRVKTSEQLLAKQTAVDEKKMSQSDRLYEAEQAFEEWLDNAEERLQRRARVGRKPVLPWSPPGKLP